jgi:hypothetical protein
MSCIFISYRREDSSGYAGRIYDRLCQHFGNDSVFMDVDGIQPGDDFVEVINRKVGSSDACVAVIGRQWATVKDQNGNRRLENPRDFVRLELAAALARNIRVIPVLVGGARMPSIEELPEPLAALSTRNAIELTDTAFQEMLPRLIHALESTVHVAAPASLPEPVVTAKKIPVWIYGALALAAVVVAFLIFRGGEARKAQIIRFENIPPQVVLGRRYLIRARSSSGLPVTVSVQGNCDLTGEVVTGVAAGTCRLSASQPGSDAFLPSTFERALRVVPAP